MKLVIVDLDSKLQNHDECDRDSLSTVLSFEEYSKFTSSRSLPLLVGSTQGKFCMIFHTFKTIELKSLTQSYWVENSSCRRLIDSSPEVTKFYVA